MVREQKFVEREAMFEASLLTIRVRLNRLQSSVICPLTVDHPDVRRSRVKSAATATPSKFRCHRAPIQRSHNHKLFRVHSFMLPAGVNFPSNFEAHHSPLFVCPTLSFFPFLPLPLGSAVYSPMRSGAESRAPTHF